MNTLSEEPLRLKRRGEDGNKMITVRIKDRIASITNYSRNELINIILKYGIQNIVIE